MPVITAVLLVTKARTTKELAINSFEVLNLRDANPCTEGKKTQARSSWVPVKDFSHKISFKVPLYDHLEV